MNTYIVEKHKADKTAGTKARRDAELILQKNGFRPTEISARAYQKKIFGVIFNQMSRYSSWKTVLGRLEPYSSLVFQWPIKNWVFRFPPCHGKRKTMGFIYLIHDLYSVRTKSNRDFSVTMKMLFYQQESFLCKTAEKIIVHNEKMKEILVKRGAPAEKIVSLNIFDYIIPEYSEEKMSGRRIRKDLPIIIAGNLSAKKAQYVYSLPCNADFNLYGVGYEEQEQKNVTYFGAFSPDELPYKLEGSFGLVWDGDSSSTCTGPYGEYMRINNPHKTSLYLASNIPVIVWKQAAIADFIKKENCGIAVDSLYEISSRIKNMPNIEYEVLRENATRIGKKLRNGEYLKEALYKCYDL